MLVRDRTTKPGTSLELNRIFPDIEKLSRVGLATKLEYMHIELCAGLWARFGLSPARTHAAAKLGPDGAPAAGAD